MAPAEKSPNDVIREEIEIQGQFLDLEISKVRLQIERADLHTRLEEKRPCRLKWTRVTRLGDGRYECGYGPDAEEGDEWKGVKTFGVKAYGRTPAEAERNFDQLWQTGEQS